MSGSVELPNPLWESSDSWFSSLGAWFHDAYLARLNNRPGEVWASILGATSQAIRESDPTASEAIEFAHLLCVRDFHDGGLLLRATERARMHGHTERAAILCALVGAQKVRAQGPEAALEYFRDAVEFAAEARDILVDLVVGDCFGDFCQAVGDFAQAQRAYGLAFRDTRLYGPANTQILLDLNLCVIKLALGEVGFVGEVLNRLRETSTAGRVADLHHWVQLLYETHARAGGPGARSQALPQALLERQLATNWSLGSNLSRTTLELVEFAKREYELQALVDHTDVGMCLTERDGQLLLCNEPFAKTYGLESPALAEGHPISALLPAERANLARTDREWVLASGEPTSREIERTEMGDVHTFLVENFPVRDTHGQIFAVGTFEIDITQRKQVEAQLRTYENSRTLAELTSRVAHDVNNVLAVILGNLEMLDTPDGKGRWKERVRACSEAVRQGSALTRNLLSLSGRQPIEVQTISLDDELRAVHALFEAAATERHEFIFDLGTGARVSVDQSRMLNSLVNLVVNARDAMPASGTITLRTRSADRGKRVEITVEDCGPGIPDALKPKVLDPFFTTKPRGVGTGLGLAMVQAFVEQADGELRLEDADPGCRVAISIPIAEATSAESAAESARGGRVGAASEGTVPVSEGNPVESEERACETILLVDDNSQMLEVIGGVMRRLKSIVSVDCRSFADVSERIRGGLVPDVALIDLALPDSDGIEVAEWLRKRAPNVGIVLMSGNAAEADRERAARVGLTAWLSKPFSLSQLGTMLLECGCSAGGELSRRFHGRR